MNIKLGFIGTGVMAGAILDRTLKNCKDIGINPSEIIIYDLDSAKMQYFEKQGVIIAKDEQTVFDSAENVLIGVKPQFFASVMANVKNIAAKNIISIMAGKEVKFLREYFGNDVGIIRVMPNTPCKIGKGVVALCFDKVQTETKNFVTKMFNSCGRTLEISEDKFHAVTGISGSGPAYLYMFANGLVKSGIDAGLTEEEAKILTFGMLEGSAAYASVSDIPLDTMVEMVCSKGGTTIEAVKCFKERDLDGTVLESVRACIRRSKELAEGK